MPACLNAVEQQIDKLKKLGARMQLDDQNRVIGVNLGERKVTDADLARKEDAFFQTIVNRF